MQWFTSDLHFAHPYVAKLRGFEDYREHDRRIIGNLNKCVKQDDDLYVLGDISSGSKDSREEALRLLHGLNVGRTHRTLILGNHDSTRLEAGRMREFANEFGQVALQGTASIPGYGSVLLSHYPWRQLLDDEPHGPQGRLSTNATSSRYRRLAIPDDGYNILLHGHTHARTTFEFKEADWRHVNVGLDAWGFSPVTMNDIDGRMQKREDCGCLPGMPLLRRGEFGVAFPPPSFYPLR